MKTSVIGPETVTDVSGISELLDTYPISRMLSGDRLGPDRIAKKYASENNIPILLMPKTNDVHLMNIQMVGFCDQVIAFCDDNSDQIRMIIDYVKRYGVYCIAYTKDVTGQWKLESN